MNSEPSHAILIVDDEANILKLLKTVIGKDDHDILTAQSGREALDLLAQKGAEVALIIADQRMPEMDGTTLLEHSAAYCPDAIRFLITGYHNVDVMVAAVNQCKIHHYIVKPWNDQSLRIEVRHAMEQYALICANKRMTARLNRKNEVLQQANQNLESIVQERTRNLTIHNESLELSHAIIDHLSTPVLGVTPDMRVAVANRAAQNLLARRTGLDSGADIGSYLDGSIKADLNACLNQCEPRCVSLNCCDGTPMKLTLTPLTGRFSGKAVIITLEDRHERD